MPHGRDLVRNSATLLHTELRQCDKTGSLRIRPKIEVFTTLTGGWYAAVGKLKSSEVAIEVWYDQWIGFPGRYDFWSGFSALGAPNTALLAQAVGISPEDLVTTELPEQTEQKKKNLYVRRSRPSPEVLQHPAIEKLGACFGDYTTKDPNFA